MCLQLADDPALRPIIPRSGAPSCLKQDRLMCRNIKTLFNFDPPATQEEIRAASLQFVRKLSGFNAPSKANEAAFNHAVDEVSRAARTLLNSLWTNAAPKYREVEAQKAKERARLRFAPR